MQDDLIIAVTPVFGGWSVECDVGMQPAMFLSGARAEQHARFLARSFTQAGQDAEVRVYDRLRQLAGATRYGPCRSYEERPGAI